MDSVVAADYIGGMELMLLRTFVVVVEIGGFTAAAERLCVTQSAISRRVRQLEEYYGVPLLDRGGELVKPTPAGTILLQRAQQMLDIENEIEESVHRLTLRRHIGFGCTPCYGTAYLPDVVERFVGAHGMVFDLNIDFQMPEQVVAGVLAGQYDVAVVEYCDDLDLKSCQAHALPADEMAFVSAPTLGLAADVLTREQLFTERLFFKARNGCAHRFLNRGLRQMDIDADKLTNLSFYDDLQGVIRQATGGHGLAFVSRSLVADELESGALRTHVLEGFDCSRPRALVVAEQLESSDIINDFVGLVFAGFAQEPPADFLSDLPSVRARPVK